MYTKSVISFRRAAVLVVTGCVALGAAQDAMAQRQDRSDRGRATTKQARGVRAAQRPALEQPEVPIVLLELTFDRPVGLSLAKAAGATGEVGQVQLRPLSTDLATWGVVAERSAEAGRLFDVLTFRDHLLVVAAGGESTVGLVIALDQEATLIDAAAVNRGDATASIVDYEADLHDVVRPTAESVAGFLDGLAVDGAVSLPAEAEAMFPALVDVGANGPQTTAAGEEAPKNPVCCEGLMGCFDTLGSCPFGTTQVSCPCWPDE